MNVMSMAIDRDRRVHPSLRCNTVHVTDMWSDVNTHTDTRHTHTRMRTRTHAHTHIHTCIHIQRMPLCSMVMKILGYIFIFFRSIIGALFKFILFF